MRGNIQAYKHKNKIEKHSFMSSFMCFFVFSQLCASICQEMFIYFVILKALVCYLYIPLDDEMSFALKILIQVQTESRDPPAMCVRVGVARFSLIHDRPVIARLCVLMSLPDAIPVYSELVLRSSIALLLLRKHYKNAC